MDIKNKIIDSSLLFMIGIIWGSQFIFIKLSLENYTVLQLAFLRTFYATVFLFIICFLMGKKFFYHRNLLDILKVIALSLLEIVIPFCMINWGQKFLSGSMAAIIIGTIPFFTIVLVSVTRLEKVSLVSLLGIIIGFLGLWVLFYPDILNQSLFDNILPKLAILSGALSFSIAILLIKTLPSENPLILSRDTFFLGSVILFFIEGSSIYQIRFDSVPPYSLFSSIILGVICSGLVYVIYVLLIKRAGASFCSLSNYLVPIFGSVFGISFFNDQLTNHMLLACLLIFISFSTKPLFKYFKLVLR